MLPGPHRHTEGDPWEGCAGAVWGAEVEDDEACQHPTFLLLMLLTRVSVSQKVSQKPSDM